MASFGVRLRAFRFAILALLLGAALPSGAARADWKKEWEETLAAARREGQVTVYIYRYERVLEEFRKDHPEIKVVAVTGRGAQLTQRIMSEKRAGRVLADVYSGGANGAVSVLYKGGVLQPLGPALILPEVTDPSRWFGGEHRYADPEQRYVVAYLANPSHAQLSYNSRLVDAREFRSHWDLVRPKWKGRIVSLDPRDTGLGATMQFLYYHPELGPEFIRKFFGTMDITFSRNFRQMTDWLAQGKFALCMGCKDSMRAKNQGLPVDDFETSGWKEGASLSTGGGSLSLLKEAPHPNAAKVFVNWFLSRRGQMALQRLGDPDDPPNSRRIDIPKEDVPPENRLREGGRYFDVVKPQYADMARIFELAKEIMKANEQKR
jgi:iron(III) transport system substrate-binding protein